MRHKRIYSEPTDNPNIMKIIMIFRNLKPKSRIRKTMWRAWFKKHKK